MKKYGSDLCNILDVTVTASRRDIPYAIVTNPIMDSNGHLRLINATVAQVPEKKSISLEKDPSGDYVNLNPKKIILNLKNTFE